jgi:hypothetical protein
LKPLRDLLTKWDDASDNAWDCNRLDLRDGYDACHDDLKEALSAIESADDWIPVSEGLPDTTGQVSRRELAKMQHVANQAIKGAFSEGVVLSLRDAVNHACAAVEKFDVWQNGVCRRAVTYELAVDGSDQDMDEDWRWLEGNLILRGVTHYRRHVPEKGPRE